MMVMVLVRGVMVHAVQSVWTYEPPDLRRRARVNAATSSSPLPSQRRYGRRMASLQALAPARSSRSKAAAGEMTVVTVVSAAAVAVEVAVASHLKRGVSSAPAPQIEHATVHPTGLPLRWWTYVLGRAACAKRPLTWCASRRTKRVR